MRVCKSSLSAEKPQNPGLTWINGCRSESTSAPTSVVIYCQTNGEAVAALVGQLGQGGQLAPHVGHPIVIAEPQRHALWEAVGAAMERRLSAKPVWLSTAGAGVSWLHVRL